jgi:6,7-dimethyl-8-ribityllumazine synthase
MDNKKYFKLKTSPCSKWVECEIQGKLNILILYVKVFNSKVKDLNVQTDIPVIFAMLLAEILRCKSIDRSGGIHGNKGKGRLR